MRNTGPLVYVVDDDASVRDGLASLLGSAGLTVKTFETGEDFLAAPRPKAASCLVLDVDLPGLSGLDLQRELAKGGAQVPVIFLTGHGDIPMTVRALKAGAANFLTKPFDAGQLLDAIRKCMESAANGQPGAGDGNPRDAAAEAPMKVFLPYRLDNINQCLWRRGEARPDERVLLTPKAFAVLRHLVEHAGRLVTQEELLDAVWPDTFVQPEVLKYQIADIRSVLGDCSKNPVFIETLPRRGYRFVAKVQEDERAETAGPMEMGQRRDELTGRAHELGELRACLARAMEGQLQVVFVTGEPGIGKTALVDEFQRQAAAEQPSLRIGRGQCAEGYGGKEAYYSTLEAMGRLCRGTAGRRVVEILATHAPTWLVQYPALVNREQRQAFEQEILGATRDRMLREIRDALEKLSSEAPLLLIFEDAQWADPSTTDLIAALGRQRTRAKMMVIVTARPADLEAEDHPLKRTKRELLAHCLCQEMALGPLSQSEVAEYLSGGSGESLHEGLASLIHQRSEGSPLLMIAILNRMVERGSAAREKGAWRFKAPLLEIDLKAPEVLRQMVEARVEKMTAEERRVLEAAAVAGTRFAANTVAAALPWAAESVEDMLGGLSRRSGIVRAAGIEQLSGGAISPVFEFVHAFYREVIQDRLSPARRDWIRRRIGDSVPDRPPEVAESAAKSGFSKGAFEFA